ncbi:MAG: helix-turn-helix domain-containing protein, partial [Anaerolineales bacterium]
MHKRTYKYRLYPTKAQQSALQKSLDACRWVYNQALA